MTFAPYFVESMEIMCVITHGRLVVVSPNTVDFQPNSGGVCREDYRAHQGGHHQESSEQPTGVIYSDETLTRLADILRGKERGVWNRDRADFR